MFHDITSLLFSRRGVKKITTKNNKLGMFCKGGNDILYIYKQT